MTQHRTQEKTRTADSWLMAADWQSLTIGRQPMCSPAVAPFAMAENLPAIYLYFTAVP